MNNNIIISNIRDAIQNINANCKNHKDWLSILMDSECPISTAQLNAIKSVFTPTELTAYWHNQLSGSSESLFEDKEAILQFLFGTPISSAQAIAIAQLASLNNQITRDQLSDMNSFVMDGDTALHMGRYLLTLSPDNVNMLLNLPSGISITDINNVKNNVAPAVTLSDDQKNAIKLALTLDATNNPLPISAKDIMYMVNLTNKPSLDDLNILKEVINNMNVFTTDDDNNGTPNQFLSNKFAACLLKDQSVDLTSHSHNESEKVAIDLIASGIFKNVDANTLEALAFYSDDLVGSANSLSSSQLNDLKKIVEGPALTADNLAKISTFKSAIGSPTASDLAVLAGIKNAGIPLDATLTTTLAGATAGSTLALTYNGITYTTPIISSTLKAVADVALANAVAGAANAAAATAVAGAAATATATAAVLVGWATSATAALAAAPGTPATAAAATTNSLKISDLNFDAIKSFSDSGLGTAYYNYIGNTAATHKVGALFAAYDALSDAIPLLSVADATTAETAMSTMETYIGGTPSAATTLTNLWTDTDGDSQIDSTGDSGAAVGLLKVAIALGGYTSPLALTSSCNSGTGANADAANNACKAAIAAAKDSASGSIPHYIPLLAGFNSASPIDTSNYAAIISAFGFDQEITRVRNAYPDNDPDPAQRVVDASRAQAVGNSGPSALPCAFFKVLGFESEIPLAAITSTNTLTANQMQSLSSSCNIDLNVMVTAALANNIPNVCSATIASVGKLINNANSAGLYTNPAKVSVLIDMALNGTSVNDMLTAFNSNITAPVNSSDSSGFSSFWAGVKNEFVAVKNEIVDVVKAVSAPANCSKGFTLNFTDYVISKECPYVNGLSSNSLSTVDKYIQTACTYVGNSNDVAEQLINRLCNGITQANPKWGSKICDGLKQALSISDKVFFEGFYVLCGHQWGVYEISSTWLKAAYSLNLTKINTICENLEDFLVDEKGLDKSCMPTGDVINNAMSALLGNVPITSKCYANFVEDLVDYFVTKECQSAQNSDSTSLLITALRSVCPSAGTAVNVPAMFSNIVDKLCSFASLIYPAAGYACGILKKFAINTNILKEADQTTYIALNVLCNAHGDAIASFCDCFENYLVADKGLDVTCVQAKDLNAANLMSIMSSMGNIGSSDAIQAGVKSVNRNSNDFNKQGDTYIALDSQSDYLTIQIKNIVSKVPCAKQEQTFLFKLPSSYSNLQTKVQYDDHIKIMLNGNSLFQSPDYVAVAGRSSSNSCEISKIKEGEFNIPSLNDGDELSVTLFTAGRGQANLEFDFPHA